MKVIPDLKFLLRHPAHFLALGFGSGLIRFAPGTWGTLAAVPMFFGVMHWPEPIHYVMLAALFLLGLPICGITSKALGIEDPSIIVWDEIVSFMLVLEFASLSWQSWLLAFVLFRLFDIWKPFPIRQADRLVKGGLGIMLDDLLAAIYAILSLKGLQWMMMHYWH